jgi:hypothetical protein
MADDDGAAGTAPSPLVLLTLLADEMHETISLLRVVDAATANRSRWRRATGGLLRTGQDVVAGMAMQYLGDNVDRARDHWIEVLRMAGEVRRRAAHDEDLRHLGEQLDARGVDGVLAKLHLPNIPGPTRKAVPYLRGVTDQIRDCLHPVQEAARRLTLQRIRSESPDPASGG